MSFQHEQTLQRAIDAVDELVKITAARGPLYTGGHCREAAQVGRTSKWLQKALQDLINARNGRKE